MCILPCVFERKYSYEAKLLVAVIISDFSQTVPVKLRQTHTDADKVARLSVQNSRTFSKMSPFSIE